MPPQRFQHNDDFIKFIKFGLAGLMNTVVDYSLFTALSYLGVGTYVAQLFSYSAGIANSYVINRSWTFKTNQKFFSPQLVKFIVVNLFLLGLSMLILFALHDHLGLHKMLAKAISTVVVVIFGFIINRIWIFS